MSKHERQSLYFNEDHLYLYQFVKKQKKPNEWVLGLIKQAYDREHGGSPSTLTTSEMPQLNQLTQQVAWLTQQLAQVQTAPFHDYPLPTESVKKMEEAVKEEKPKATASVTSSKPDQVSTSPDVELFIHTPKETETLIQTQPKKSSRFSSTDL